jgi:glyceraldehyde-3-phosphate dehydrogenase/erythrose-4-phosphate dehydrogenase
MPIRVAINGFGRVGRSVLRSAYERGTHVKVIAWYDNEWGSYGGASVKRQG